MSECPPKIVELVGRFELHREQYKSGKYNETQVRREFIDPMFKALGWDVDNEQGNAESYKDVIHEDAIKIGSATKAPDYCFRIGGRRKFFLEAKKPSVYIKEEIPPAFQIRRYAWSSKLSLSILTDFEEFAVYDCRIKPDKNDKASTARVFYIKYTEYLERWHEIAGIFSKEAVLKGSFDKYAETTKKKKGTAEVDDAFLKEIEGWRDVLAINIALRNENISQRDLNYTVQTTIDRIIFLRICEDRGVEHYARLMAVTNGDGIYPRLLHLFYEADDKYNSGLFHFKKEKGRLEEPDELSAQLKIDDKILRDMIRSLYYPDSPYEFSALPADILGQVYEQFLGKVIRLTPGHRAVVEDKPEVKKAGGVFYTPTYIVDYIVESTVGKLLEGKTPKQADGITICDPACGSGSFLIGAYQYLLDWRRDYYVENGAEKFRKELYQSQSGEWRLTIQERKRILLNSIYGVDIDSQAVETTKLSLLLKVLEQATEETINQSLRLFHERALPDLASNIKCGNSLIGPDFYNGHQLDILDDEERYRINVFDWQSEFKAIMKSGGFDAVIGNPPYVRMESFKEIKDYLKSIYVAHSERADIYYYFVERAEKLLSEEGLLGFILSNTFTRSHAGQSLRALISTKMNLVTLVEFGDFTPFVGATVYPIIVVAKKTKRTTKNVNFALQDHDPSTTPQEKSFPVIYSLPKTSLGQEAWIFEDRKSKMLRDKLLAACTTLLEQYGEVRRGIVTGLNEAFLLDDQARKDIIRAHPNAKKIFKPYLNGKDLDRWKYHWNNEWIIYTYHGIDMSDYASVQEHLKPFKSRLQKRSTKQKWHELQQPQEAFTKMIDSPKIIFPDISRYPKFSIDTHRMYFSNTVYFIASDSLFLLGLLNSKLLWFVIRGFSNALRGGMWRFRLFSGHVERLPMRTIDLNNKSEKSAHDKMVSLVESMLALNKKLAETKTDHDKKVLQRQIAATDNQIDNLVYELYDLTEEEISIVEKQ